MYNDFFGFKATPFSIAPDPRYLYMTAQHRDALAHLVYGFNSDGGCILLTGEVGTGKTTICRCLLEQIPDKANVALVLNPKVSEIELLETICDELKIDYPDGDNSVKTYTDRIYDFLIESNRRNEKTVLIIDEAQNLNSEVLEQLRLLTNLETDQHKLLQIIILGQPELLDILASKEMRQLAQRITARFHLNPLSRNELKAYISHRLAVAGQNIQLFPENSVSLIYRASKGVPRLINIICDRALLGAYVENQHRVDPSIVKKASREVFGELKQVEHQRLLRRWLLPVIAVISIVTIAILLTISMMTEPETSQTLADSTDTQIEQSAANSRLEIADGESVDDTATGSSRTTDDVVVIEDVPASMAPGNIEADALLDTDIATSQVVTPLEATTRPQAASDQPGVLDEIDSLFSQHDSDNRINAFVQLFRRWGQDFDYRSSTNACTQASRHSLGCLHRLGNINSLRTHDRPAVLTLVDRQGTNRYLTITRIEDETATVLYGDREYLLSLDEIDRHWYGKFTILWHKPKDYRKVISPGDSGDIIGWLHAQLDHIGMMQDQPVSTTYDSALQQTVKRFQQQRGLIADGIVGPLTIIHLNTVSGRAVPSLLGTQARG
jgi:general secretion pathway protein A